MALAIGVWPLQGMLGATCHRGTLVAALLHKATTLRAAISHSATLPKEVEVRTVPTLVGTKVIVREMFHDSHQDRAEGSVRGAKSTMAMSRVGLGQPLLQLDCRVSPSGSGESSQRQPPAGRVYALTVNEAAFSKEPTQERK
ncbi:hypothetical protein PIB30_076966 [Stylosanthes scabra]|uniref:Uncharacterized protein n=1 Tax=Stylosanthes scabra TaxID=79078 RepID=A0ABU6RQ91_9FABA|nr:hypothetical protein [Stylosanthes scabra]